MTERVDGFAMCRKCRCCSLDKTGGCYGQCDENGHVLEDWCARCESDGWLLVMSNGRPASVGCPDCAGTGRNPE